jgi:Caudovirus prohead serine protease
MTDPRAKLRALLDGVDLDLSPKEEIVAGLEQRSKTIAAMARQYGNTRAVDIDRKEVAVVEPTEEITGEFQALISDFRLDRHDDRFAPGAFDNALKKIRRAARRIPVLVGHSDRHLDSVIGGIPAEGFWVDSEGLHARGWIDVSTSVGKRLYK